MKKLLLLLIAITLAIGVSGCSTGDKPNTSTPSTSGSDIHLPDQPF